MPSKIFTANVYAVGISAVLLVFGLAACKKERGAISEDASYIRFFNGLTYYRAPVINSDTPESIYFSSDLGGGLVSTFYGLTGASSSVPAAFSDHRPAPLVTLLIDPTFDKQGFPVSAATTGDFIAVQSLPGLGISIDNAGKPTNGQNFTFLPQNQDLGNPERNIQYDFPGNQILKRAPVVGGVDLSRWAEIQSGKHRIVIVYRILGENNLSPVSSRLPYLDLSAVQKVLALKDTPFKTVVAVDTLLDFDAGSVYTLRLQDKTSLSLVQQSAFFSIIPKAGPKTELVVRNENFSQQSLSSDKLYVRFFNNTNSPSILPDEFDVYSRISYITRRRYTFNPTMGIYTLSGGGGPKYTNLEKIGTVKGRFDTKPANNPYIEIPSIPRDSLLNPDNTYIPRLPPEPFTVAAGIGKFSHHEFYFYKSGTTPPNPTANTPTGFIGFALRNLNLQPTITAGTEYFPQNVLNTVELNTRYEYYNLLDGPGTNPDLRNYDAILIQEQFAR